MYESQIWDLLIIASITIIMYFEYEKAILSTLSQCEIIKVCQLVCWNKKSMKT